MNNRRSFNKTQHMMQRTSSGGSGSGNNSLNSNQSNLNTSNSSINSSNNIASGGYHNKQGVQQRAGGYQQGHTSGHHGKSSMERQSSMGSNHNANTNIAYNNRRNILFYLFSITIYVFFY